MHLKYLQFILIEFDPDFTLEENTMIWYFRKGIRPSVRVQIEQRSQELNNFKKMVEKTVNAKAKAALWPRSYARNINQFHFQGSQPSTTKINTQDQPIKDSQVKKPKLRSQKLKALTLQHSDSAETFEQAQKKMKKKEKQERRVPKYVFGVEKNDCSFEPKKRP